jgi:hypothetical protein
LQKTVQYLTACKGIASTVTSGLILPVTFKPAPVMLTVPKHRWLMQVYAQDVLQRLEEIKATITSQCGRVLKMDSQKRSPESWQDTAMAPLPGQPMLAMSMDR